MALLDAAVATVGALSRPAVVIPAALRCEDADAIFRADRDLTALVVRGDDSGGDGSGSGGGGGAVGLLPRSRFEAEMAGPYGYGRALHYRRPVARLTDWDPIVVDPDAAVEDTSNAVLGRRWAVRYDDVVVSDPAGELATVSVTELLEALAAQLASRALHDPLTGLGNRDLLVMELERQCAAGPVALVFVDLDRFKQVNDGLGHNVGDALLRAVADRLRATARPGDVVARVGGDEFVVLLALDPDTTDRSRLAGEVARRVARRLLLALRRPVDLAAWQLSVRASVGVAVGLHGADATTMLREGDLAMYRAKRAGGDRVEVVDDVRAAIAPTVDVLPGEAVRGAVRAGQLELHFQPIVELAGGGVVSVEALVRWRHPEQGLLTPDRFLPAAIRDGAVVDLDTWVLHEACRQLVRWDAELGPQSPPHVNVNLSTVMIGRDDLASRVLAALAESGLSGSRLRLELPETATVEQVQLAAPQLVHLREHGVAVTLDDVGAGSSTLRHVTVLDVDGVKVDRTFVAAMLEDHRALAVVRLLLDLAASLRLRVTAEGIETLEQLEELRRLGCTYGQGYFLARPVPAAGLPRLLGEWPVQSLRAESR